MKKNNQLLNLKFFLKKIIKYLLQMRKFIYSPIVNNKKIIFDNFEKDKELLAINNYNEKYIVNSSDIFIGRSLYINGNFEFDIFLEALKILQNKIKKKTLIDIGANIGSICIPAIKRGIFSNCLAIEPDPYNFNLLSKNIFINDLSDKILTYNYALSQFDDENLKFSLSNNNFGDHRIVTKIDRDKISDDIVKKIITIKSRKLDTLLGAFNPNETLIWMDVQGYEGFVLDGGINTITKKPPLVIEFEPFLIEKLNSYNLLKKNIINAKYKNCYNLNSKYFMEDISEKSLDNLYSELKRRNYTATNLLFFN
jgi:FkbM family methyltransferase